MTKNIRRKKPTAINNSLLDNFADLPIPAEENVTCSLCDKVLRKEEISAKHLMTFLGEKICESCFSLRYFVCHNCSGRFRKDRISLYVIGVKVYCNMCHSDLFVGCYHCGQDVLRGNAMTSRDGHFFDARCYGEEYTICLDCGTEIRRNTSYENSRGERQRMQYCINCYHRHIVSWNITNLMENDDEIKEEAVGFEIECYPRKEVATVAEKHKNDIAFFQLGTDGSLNPGGVEIRTCVIPMKKLEQFLNTNRRFLSNFLVDKKCGLHAHINMFPYFDKDKVKTVRDLAEIFKKMLVGFKIIEDYMFETQPYYRRKNHFCHRIGDLSPDLQDIERFIDLPASSVLELYYKRFYTKVDQLPFGNHQTESRYCWANCHSITYRNTMEIRLHTGSTNPTKMYLWGSILNKIIKWLMKNDMVTIADEWSVEKMQSVLSKEEVEYLEKRRDKFKDISKYPETSESESFNYNGKILADDAVLVGSLPLSTDTVEESESFRGEDRDRSE